MMTSRKDGILVLHTAKKYKMACQGVMTEQNEIVCKEITYPVESIAFDMDQLFCRAIMSMRSAASETHNAEPETVVDEYETKDSPTESEVSEHTKDLELMFKMNTGADMSTMVTLFTKLVNAGMVVAFGDTKMTDKSIWPDIAPNDKLKIMFAYISFFIKPLANLVASSTQKPESKGSAATAE